MADKIELEPLATPESARQPALAGRPPVVIIQTEDEEIYCPVCNYNLTGIYSGRCPECGSFFDRAVLIAAQQTNQITLIPWDDPQPMPLRSRFWQTLCICLVNAERFAYAFSVRPQRSRAFSFFAATTAILALLGIILLLLHLLCVTVLAPVAGLFYGRRPTPITVVAAAVGIVSFAILSSGITTLLAALVLWVSRPHYDDKRHFRPWLSICAYASAHYVLTGIAFPFVFVLALYARDLAFFELCSVMFLAWFGCAMLCGFTLRGVVNLRTPATEQTATPWWLLAPILLGVPIVNLFAAAGIAALAEDFLLTLS